MGCVDGSPLAFEFKSLKNHHERLDGRMLQRWSAEFLHAIKWKAVAVMDNAA